MIHIPYKNTNEMETMCGFSHLPTAFVSDQSQHLTQQSDGREAGGEGKNVWIWVEF